LNDLWNEHIRAEFAAHSPDEAIVTMVANPRVNQVPVMIGGDGRDELYEYLVCPAARSERRGITGTIKLHYGRNLCDLVKSRPKG
jgi:hypothetical protein